MIENHQWEPPETLEETLKRLFVPAPLYIRYLYQKSLRRGEKELRFIPELADPARTSLDVGANKGVYAYALSLHSRRVHAFEPNPKLFKVLKKWGRGKIDLHPMALSDVTGSANLFIPRSAKGFSNQGASLSTDKVTSAHGVLSVQCSRLDDLGIEDVGFMKIDVEGAETRVIEGARETIERDRPVMMLELEEKHTGRPIEDMVADVVALGYECRYVLGERLASFEGFDPVRQHRNAKVEDYVFNFIFRPSESAG